MIFNPFRLSANKKVDMPRSLHIYYYFLMHISEQWTKDTPSWAEKINIQSVTYAGLPAIRIVIVPSQPFQLQYVVIIGCQLIENQIRFFIRSVKGFCSSVDPLEHTGVHEWFKYEWYRDEIIGEEIYAGEYIRATLNICHLKYIKAMVVASNRRRNSLS